MKPRTTTASTKSRIADLLGSLYGERVGADTERKLDELLTRHTPTMASRPNSGSSSERDALLITYADQVSEPDVAPHVQLITKTNVPHADNISYFGDGTNEAQLVYNFALPPLVLHALLAGDATHPSRWAVTLKAPSDRTTFFNFLASHDGIGLNPARGILPQPEIDFLAARCQAHGGFINYKHNADGSKSPYEMNVIFSTR